MRRLGVAPITQMPGVDDWLKTVGDRLKLYSGASDPTADEVPEGQWIIYKNTTSGDVKIWVNDSGVMKSTAALT